MERERERIALVLISYWIWHYFVTIILLLSFLISDCTTCWHKLGYNEKSHSGMDALQIKKQLWKLINDSDVLLKLLIYLNLHDKKTCKA